MNTRTEEIEALERQLADLMARMPAHSIPPAMMIELDELEERLTLLRAGDDKEEAS